MLLDYGGSHASFNRHHGVSIGVMEIVFTDAKRDRVKKVRWRSQGAGGFAEAPVNVALQMSLDEFEQESGAVEGRRNLVRHVVYERKQRKKKIAEVLRSGKALKCETCGLDFEAVYGALGKRVCEVHHEQPLSKIGERQVPLSELHVLCANCHRGIHRTEPLLSPAEFSAQHVSSAFKRRVTALGG